MCCTSGQPSFPSSKYGFNSSERPVEMVLPLLKGHVLCNTRYSPYKLLQKSSAHHTIAGQPCHAFQSILLCGIYCLLGGSPSLGKSSFCNRIPFDGGYRFSFPRRGKRNIFLCSKNCSSFCFFGLWSVDYGIQVFACKNKFTCDWRAILCF